MLKFVQKYFSSLVVFALISGALLGYFIDNGTFHYLAAKYLVASLFLMLFAAMLNIKFEEVIHHVKKPYLVLLNSFLKLIVLPVVVFFIASYLPKEFIFGLTLVASVPAAVSAPSLMILFKGKIGFTLLITVLTNLLAPFTIPLVLKYTVSSYVEFDVFSVFIFLLIVMLGSFLIALVLRRWAKNFTKRINENSSQIVSLILITFAFAFIIPYSKALIADPILSLKIFVVSFGLFITLHLLPLLFTYRYGRQSSATYIVLFAYTNVGLGLVLASEYFDTTTVLIAVMYDIFWTLGMGPMKRVFAGRR